MKKWYFPYGFDIEKESVNNARIETFRDNILESLARETCQNSLDAAINSKEPVKMVFEEKFINTSELIDKESFIKDIIPKSRKTWENDVKAQEFLDNYENILNQEKIKILRISDYNTIGLEKGNWESLIEIAGTSVKENITSAGSFGIGKAAPFASSELRMVFYNTRLRNGEQKSIGVTKFISFDKPDGTIAQGVGYLGEKKKDPMKDQVSFGFPKRKESGTDIYIIGFNQDDKWKDVIIESLLENFLISIYKEKILIDIEGTIIDKNSIGYLIKNLEGRKHDQLKNYYSVLEDENAKVFKLDERFKEFGIKSGDGTLILAKREGANRSVLMTRKAGMKIKDMKNISGSIQFNGIFQATGEKFNEILKDMENPSHNNWIPERYKKDPKKAEKLLKTIYRFVKDNVMEHYQEKIEKQVDAFGMSDFLPNKLNKESNKEKKTSSLNSSISEIVLKPRKIKNIQAEGLNEDELQKDLERSGITDGDELGAGTPKNNKIISKGGNNDKGIGQSGGKNKEDKGGEEVILEKNAKFKESRNTKAKIIEKDYIEGEYRILLKSLNNVKKLKVEIGLVGETGHRYKDNIEDVKYNGRIIKYKENYFILENIKKNKAYLIDFKIAYKNRIKMGVKVYENK